MDRPIVLPIEPLRSARLDLEPLSVDHADEAAPLFADPALHTYTGGSPAGLDELRSRYRRQSVGSSPDGRDSWLNWMLRDRRSGRLVGTVQATVTPDRDGPAADLAWVVATAHQGQGCAREAAAVVADWLHEHGVHRLRAAIHPDHEASAGVARGLGLEPTDTVVDGEVRWQRG
ncbi:GNAT family N-acetyltransferase [Blastococcus xanthinilyticus]|uniref:RimJ/RimL family protein N-acetyltransferase n=1 Tax=Blastococcus xanthinilyticus TaxID=1564164 RepID=A0A5S5CWU2_9ACTN|nr:GNAT family N-acetyltransferase [Blastococcus xanthinilyticus]TYP86829.1 RimJ/RimL family protein N-acetyltransferase [Blastococcus xanthinilyticus]